MVIARRVGHDLRILDRVREPICLAAGLDSEQRLTDEVQEAALDCLSRMGQRLRHLDSSHVRAVGTNTLRRARNTREFRLAAKRVLGHPVEVVSGQEEARLIYLGVAHSLPAETTHRLVVDIGGGSTEIILGRGFDVLRTHSLYLGCVGHSLAHFPAGLLHKEAFQQAEVAARLELRPIAARLKALGWQGCVGASGTIGALSEMVRSDSSGEVTLPALKRLRKEMIAAGHVDGLTHVALKPDRARVIAGGLAILMAVFKELEIEALTPSNWALREGVLYDLIGRIQHEDARDRTIRRLVEQYHVDLAQAQRVEQTARHLLEGLPAEWVIDATLAHQVLGWATRLHEIGLAVSFTGFHKHGAYLVTHSEMPGFSSDDQLLLAALIRGHRRKLSRGVFAELATDRTEFALWLCVVLRLATLLNRGRTSEGQLEIDVQGARRLVLRFPVGWLAQHPLTRADLRQESDYLAAVGLELVITEVESTVSRGT